MRKPTPGLVSLYDTQRGTLLGQFHPSALITPHLPQPPAVVLAELAADEINPDVLTYINYTHLLWSPDGQRLAITFQTFVVTGDPNADAPPGQAFDGILLTDAATLAASPSWIQAPRLPVHDAGLQQAIAVAGTNSLPDARGVLVAWRPDGKQIAVDADQPDHAVIVFDCATGQPVATLVPPRHQQGSLLQGFTNMLRWSPDGSQLALYDATVATLTIWSGARLPR